MFHGNAYDNVLYEPLSLFFAGFNVSRALCSAAPKVILMLFTDTWPPISVKLALMWHLVN